MSIAPYRILHVFGSMNCGGAETRIMDLYRHIDKTRVQFDFLVLFDGEHYYNKEIRKLGGRIFTVRHPRSSLIAHLTDMYKIMKNEGPFQAVHAHTSYHSGLSLLIGKIAGIKHRVCHARTTSTKNAQSIKKKTVLYLGRRLILSNATSLVAISKSAARFLFGNKIIENGNAKIIPNSIDLNLYRDDKFNNVLDIKRKLKIPESALVIGHVGRFSFMKNHKFIIKIAKYLKYNNIDFRIILVGDGETKPDIEQLVIDLELTDNVIFLGIRDDIPQLMKLFDVLIMPSLFEGLGGVVIEAQAAGTPCVVSNTLPLEVDMGIGLVDFLPLSCPIEEWAEKIINAKLKPKMDFEKIYSVFLEKKFTLDYEEEALMKIYGLKKD